MMMMIRNWALALLVFLLFITISFDNKMHFIHYCGYLHHFYQGFLKLLLTLLQMRRG